MSLKIFKDVILGDLLVVAFTNAISVKVFRCIMLVVFLGHSSRASLAGGASNAFGLVLEGKEGFVICALTVRTLLVHA